MTPPSLRIALFALTGMGNAVLRAVRAAGHEVVGLATRAEPGPYPYYPERNLATEAKGLGIPTWEGEGAETHLASCQPDVALVATYHRKIVRVPGLPDAIFNIHPSLLPAYQGANPYFWVLRHGVARTGVSVHILSDEIDAGEVVLAYPYEIAAMETQGSLRLVLAKLAAMAALEVLRHIQSRTCFAPVHLPQATFSPAAPKVKDGDCLLRAGMSAVDAERLILAATPYPGVRLAGTGMKVEALETILPRTPGESKPGSAWPAGQPADPTRVEFMVSDARLLLRVLPEHP